MYIYKYIKILVFINNTTSREGTVTHNFFKKASCIYVQYTYVRERPFSF